MQNRDQILNYICRQMYPTFKETYSSPQSGRWKREASDEDDPFDIDTLSAAELLDISRDSAVESAREDDGIDKQ